MIGAFFSVNNAVRITTMRIKKMRFPRMLRVAVRNFPIQRKRVERAENIFFMKVVLG